MVVFLDVAFAADGLLPTIVMILFFIPFVWGLGTIAGAGILTFKRGGASLGLLALGLNVTSGAYFPLTLFPDWVVALAEKNPIAIAMNSSRQALLGTGLGGRDSTPSVHVLLGPDHARCRLAGCQAGPSEGASTRYAWCILRRLTAGSRLLPRDRVVQRELRTGAVLLNLADGSYFEVNPVGLAIWNGLDGRPLEDVVGLVRSEFEVAPDELENEVYAFVAALLQSGLIEDSEGD